MENALTLYELNSLVVELIDKVMPSSYWVEAEIADARESKGHLYLELIEKDESTNIPIARASAKCWRSSWLMIGPHFERVAGVKLRAGLQIMIQVHAQFHAQYGFSWIIDDINPEYTMGSMARKRNEIIAQLKVCLSCKGNYVCLCLHSVSPLFLRLQQQGMATSVINYNIMNMDFAFKCNSFRLLCKANKLSKV